MMYMILVLYEDHMYMFIPNVNKYMEYGRNIYPIQAKSN